MSKLTATSLLLFIVALTSCVKPTRPPVVIFDGWWAADYAKNFCKRAPLDSACVGDPIEEVRHFEATLRTEFGSLASCQGIEFIVLVDPAKADQHVRAAMKRPHWSLIVNYMPGQQKQSWWLKRSDSTAAAEEEGSAMEIAGKICPIVNQRGARLE